MMKKNKSTSQTETATEPAIRNGCENRVRFTSG